MSLDTGRPQPPAGKSALAVTALAAAAVLALAACSAAPAPVLAQMYAGHITRWNDPAIRNLNPGVSLPGSAIVLVHRQDASGSTFLFTSYMNAQDPADWSSSLIGTTVARPWSPCPMPRLPRLRPDMTASLALALALTAGRPRRHVA